MKESKWRPDHGNEANQRRLKWSQKERGEWKKLFIKIRIEKEIFCISVKLDAAAKTISHDDRNGDDNYYLK